MNAEIICIQDPYLDKDKIVPQSGYSQIGVGRAIILVKKKIIAKIIIDNQPNYNIIQIGKLTIINCYLPPKVPIIQTLVPIDCSINRLNTKEPLIICGDFNCGTALLKKTPNNIR